jgi:hypothetical protein
MQRAVRRHAFDEHRQLVHVSHHPRGRSAAARDQAHQISGLVDPNLIDDGLEFAPAHVADRVLLAAGPVRQQQFLQQLVVAHHPDLPTVIVRHSTGRGAYRAVSISVQLFTEARRYRAEQLRKDE